MHRGRVLTVQHGVVLFKNQRRGAGGITDNFSKEDPLLVVLEFLRITSVSAADLLTMVDKPAGKKQFLTREELKSCLQVINSDYY